MRMLDTMSNCDIFQVSRVIKDGIVQYEFSNSHTDDAPLFLKQSEYDALLKEMADVVNSEAESVDEQEA